MERGIPELRSSEDMPRKPLKVRTKMRHSVRIAGQTGDWSQASERHPKPHEAESQKRNGFELESEWAAVALSGEVAAFHIRDERIC
jgi:hypothetical protein